MTPVDRLATDTIGSYACNDPCSVILLVPTDDDARNIFALSSVLERRAMCVLTATTGSEAALLDANLGAAIVLTDIMMPEIDMRRSG